MGTPIEAVERAVRKVSGAEKAAERKAKRKAESYERIMAAQEAKQSHEAYRKAKRVAIINAIRFWMSR